VEQLLITPPATNPPAYEIFLLADIENGASVVVEHTSSARGRATIEIYNDADGIGRPQTRSNDMRVTVRGFEVRGLGDARALKIFHRESAPNQDYLTGLFLEDNFFESATRVEGVLDIGNKSYRANGLYFQPLKWGHILNNEVIATGSGAGVDALSAYHFVGTIANNNPRFQGLISGSNSAVSFMLKTDGQPSPCYPVTPGLQSDAIDVGFPGINRYDLAGGPGLGLPTCDIGAYGGPFNMWDPNGTLPCVEYVEGVGECGSP